MIWDLRFFDDEERAFAEFVQRNLDDLSDQVHRFRAALILFQNCLHHSFGLIGQSTAQTEVLAGEELLRRWTHVAARDGILTVYNVAELMRAVDGAASKSPTLRDHRDKGAAGEARAILKEAFPNLELVRHGAAHAARFSSTQKRLDEHVSTESNRFVGVPNGGKIYISESIFDETFTCTVKGKVVSYDLSPDSFAAVRKICGLVWDSFLPIEPVLRARHAEQSGGNR